MQLGCKAAFPPGEAREDWTILRAFSDVIGKTLPYDTLDALRRRMVEAAPHFANIEQVDAGGMGSLRQGRAVGRGSLQVSLARHLFPDQSDLPRLQDHGEMHRGDARR